MGNNNLEIRVVLSQWQFGIEMVFADRDHADKIISIGKLIMEEYTPGSRLPEESRININDKTAQILMDDLWKCGIRPTEGTGSAGSLKATENHLEDMRKIVSSKLEINL